MPIQQPAMQHHFIVRVEGTPQEFTEQSAAFAANFVRKELIMIVEQSVTATTKEHVVIQDWIDHPKRLITLEITDPSGAIVDTIKFRDCTIADHAVEFNYANVATVVHVLSMNYDKIELGNNKPQSAFASAMSVIGKP